MARPYKRRKAEDEGDDNTEEETEGRTKKRKYTRKAESENGNKPRGNGKYTIMNLSVPKKTLKAWKDEKSRLGLSNMTEYITGRLSGRLAGNNGDESDNNGNASLKAVSNIFSELSKLPVERQRSVLKFITDSVDTGVSE